MCVLDPTAVAGLGRLGVNLYGVTACMGTDEILVVDFDHYRVVALAWLPPSHDHVRAFRQYESSSVSAVLIFLVLLANIVYVFLTRFIGREASANAPSRIG
jgi:hypothetical protein